MISSVARYAPSIVAGSALAGFGLAFGRDVYKQTKKNWHIAAILACLVGVFFSGMWLFRNYRTPGNSLFKKLGALIVLIGSCSAILFAAQFLLIPPPWVIILQVVLFLIGAAFGISHRKRRRLAWEAEDHNEDFLEAHNLEVIDVDEKGNLRLRDHDEGIGYRMMVDLDITGELEFMALGKRNKRGYLEYDRSGKYTHWSGLANVH